MADQAHEWTDEQLERLTRRYESVYSQAASEMKDKLKKSLGSYEKENEQRQKAMDDTPESRSEYEAWKRSQAASQSWMSDMVDSLSESAVNANRHATDMLNDSLPHVYAENANMTAYALDGQLGHDTGFTLVNEDAVRYLMGLEDQDVGYDQLIREVTWNPDPERSHVQDVRKREMDYPRDMRWNRQKFSAAITQGILQGESIPQIERRVRDIYGRNKAAAVRAARTATTNAENAGRMNTFERAQALGIDMELEWLATPDGRTRSSHRALDGERIQLGETFSNGLRWPGDPLGKPDQLWNCRCRANGRVVGFDGKRGDWADERGERWTRLPKGMTYDEWKAGIKADDKKAKSRTPSTLEGFRDYEKRYIESNRASYRLDDEQMEHLRSMVGKMFDESEVYAYVSGDAIQDVVRGGHLMNILELSTDEAYNAERRALAEQLFGIDASKLSADEFEKYGFLGSRDAEKVLGSGTNAQIYGDICVRFKKERVKNRTTYTFGDSFNEVQRGSDIIAGGLSDRLSVSGIQPSEARRTYAAMSKLEESGVLDATDVTQKTVGRYGYIEAQLHGKLDSEEIEAAFVKCRREDGAWVPKDGGSELMDLLRLAKFDVFLVDENGRIIRKLGE